MPVNPKKVEHYYDRMTKSYLATYGHTIQAFRPSDTAQLHEHVLKNAGIEDGMSVLDVGCGVAGPAIYFAQRKKINISGITISQVQVDEGMNALKGKELLGKVELLKGDFHELPMHYDESSFDRILFLESLGHSHDSGKVIKDAFKLLKNGGYIYIKDFYPLEIADPEKKRKHQTVIDRINHAYSYNVLDLNTTITQLRETGFELDFIKRFDFPDDIEARSAFEAANDIQLYEGLELEFRVAEWFEIRCQKPLFPLF